MHAINRLELKSHSFFSSDVLCWSYCGKLRQIVAFLNVFSFYWSLPRSILFKLNINFTNIAPLCCLKRIWALHWITAGINWKNNQDWSETKPGPTCLKTTHLTASESSRTTGQGLKKINILSSDASVNSDHFPPDIRSQWGRLRLKSRTKLERVSESD